MPYTTPDIINVSAGTTSNNLSNITFSNSNGVSFGLNGSTITASHNGLTSQSNQAFSADASSTFQTLIFQDSNGVSFSNNAGSLRVTHGLQFTSNTSNITSNALNTSASRVINIVAATNNTGGGTASLSSNVSFSNANGATFYTSAGGAIALSYTVPAGGGVAISGGANSQSTGTVNFANSNGITFGLSNNGTMTASHNGLTTARASNDGVGLNTALTAGPLAWTVNSNGISLNAGSAAGTTSGFAGNQISGSMTHNTAGLNLSLNHPAWITTARASNDAIGLNTAQSNVTWTVNSSGLSLDARGYAGTATTFNGANISGSITLNSNGLNLSLSGATAAPSPVNISAGTTSNNLASIVFSNSNGVSFGLSGSTVTASHNGITSQSNQNVSLYALGNTTQNSSTVLNASQLSFNGLGELSVGFSNGSINLSANVDAISAYAVSNTTQSTSGTLNVGSLSFNGAGGASVGVSNGSIVVSAPVNRIESYYDNNIAYQGTTAFTMGASSNFVQPFILPFDLSASYIRIANSWAFGSTTGGTTANQSLTLNNSQSIYVNIYSKGVGASSKSLQYVTGGSVSLVFQVRAEIGAASNNQTVSHNFTYPSSEGGAQGNFATNYNVNSASYNISTTHLTSFNGSRWLDIPFAVSLSRGEYWMAVAQSTATATTGGVAAMTNVTARNTFVAVSQVNANIALMGVSSNMSTAPMRNGLGYWSTNSNGASTSSIGLASISSVANQPLLPFQIIREA